MTLEREEVFFVDRAAMRQWLRANNETSPGVWAIFYKKTSGLSDLSWEALVEECLCFGWIDSLPGKVDELRTKIYITPRKANSGWSRRNKLVLVELQNRGLIEAPGFAAIERAKLNGSWTRFDLAEDLVLPIELDEALKSDDEFNASWLALTDSQKRQFLQQIYDAKTDATRLKRIRDTRVKICLSN